MGPGSLGNKRYSPENMDDKKVTAPRRQDDNNKRWSPKTMDDKKFGPQGVRMIIIRDGP
jgi:hypothetical protein